MKKYIYIKLLAVSLLSGFLFSCAYTNLEIGWLAIIALTLLFSAEYSAKENGLKNFWICYFLCFLVWNALATYWIWYATKGGAVAAILLNSLQMAVIFRVFRWMRCRFQGMVPYLAFAALWLCWEHFYFTWQVSWPWLTLGNSFAALTKYVQWYSVTGTLGGSLWILLASILLFFTIKSFLEKKKRLHYSIALVVIVLAPIIWSLSIYNKVSKDQETLPKREVVVLQPNIDPYNTKFTASQSEQDSILLNLASSAVTPQTFLVIAPETFFNPSKEAGLLVEDSPHSNKSVKRYNEFVQTHNLNFLYGAVTQLSSVSMRQPSPYSRNAGLNFWINVFNSAVLNTTDGRVYFYHKSKLVILAESVPVINKKPVFESLGIDLGGEIGNFTPQKYRYVFKTQDEILFGTAICYESVFGDFYREYVQKGAQFMTIITNDGWWRDTPGHIQHFNYARLRAVETHRYTARSANTGISAIIDAKGDVVEQTPWWEECYLRGEVALNKEITPFVRYGDIVGIVASWCALAFVVLALLSYLFKKRRG